MNAKDYLTKAYNLDKFIDACLVELSNIKRQSQIISSIDYTRDKIQKSPENRIENTIVKLIDKENLINDKIDELVDLKTEIRSKIDCIPDETERLLLTYRYLCFLSWEEIADKMSYSCRNIHYLHTKALKSFESLHLISYKDVI